MKINRWDSGLQTILLVLLKLTITVFLYCKFLGGIYMKLKRVKSDLQSNINNIMKLRMLYKNSTIHIERKYQTYMKKYINNSLTA